MAIDLGGQPSESSPTIKLATPGAQWQAAMIDVGEFHASDFDSNDPLYWQADRTQGKTVTDQPCMSPVITWMLIASQGCTTGEAGETPPNGLVFSEFIQGAKYIEWRDALAAHVTTDRGFCVGDIGTHWFEGEEQLERGKVRKHRKYHIAANTDAAMVQRCEELHLAKNRTELTPPAAAPAPAPAVGGPPAMAPAPAPAQVAQAPARAAALATVPPAQVPAATVPGTAPVAGGPPPMNGLQADEEPF